MFIALRAGKFDHLIGEGGEPASAAGAPAPAPSAPTAAAAPPPVSTNGAESAATAGAPSRRAPMPSLIGATEFARADLPAPDAAPAPKAPASQTPATPAPPSRPNVNNAAAHADTIALKAVSDPVTAAARAASPGGARLTPPPPRPPDATTAGAPAAGAPTSSPLSPLRALGSRTTPAQATQAAAASPQAPAEARPANPPAMPKLERPGTRTPSVPPPRPDVTPAPRPPLSASLDLDLEALERAAEQSQAPVYQQIRDLPPPPASLLKPTAPRNTSYRSVTPQATQIVNDGRSPATTGHAQDPAAPPPVTPPRGIAPTIPRAPASNRGAAQRYAPSRPASIFGSSRPQEGSSIFGEDLISEKSLDEVILSYLAEDLEGPGGSGTKK